MRNLLYYPYINLPETDWVIRALLYYDELGVIVPNEFSYDNSCFNRFMRELIRENLIKTIDPMQSFEKHGEIAEIFFGRLESANVDERRSKFISGNISRLHSGKFESLIYENLVREGLARRTDYSWYDVERTTANELMAYLASAIAVMKNYIPATDTDFTGLSVGNRLVGDFALNDQQHKRDLILKRLMPYPKRINMKNLRKFKDNHYELLRIFSIKVEQIVEDTTITQDSTIFQLKLKEMEYYKRELLDKMNESRMKDINWGTVAISLLTTTLGVLNAKNKLEGAVTVLGALAEVYKALKPRDVQDNYGLKYLALIEQKFG